MKPHTFFQREKMLQPWRAEQARLQQEEAEQARKRSDLKSDFQRKLEAAAKAFKSAEPDRDNAQTAGQRAGTHR